MKANLSVILERWAELYDAIGHNRKSKDGKKEKAFYLIRAINEDNEFVRNFNQALRTFAEIKRKRPKNGGAPSTFLMGYRLITDFELSD